MADARNLHIMFIPFLSRSHCLSLLDAAILFAQRGARCTIVTTPANSSYLSGIIDSEALPIDLLLLPFPAAEAALPPGIECTDLLSGLPEFPKLFTAMQLLARPINDLIVDQRPDVLVLDMVLHCFARIACSNSVPFFLFNNVSPLHNAVSKRLGILDDDERPTVPSSGLPGPLKFMRSQLPAGLQEAEDRSCGVMCNSFEELTQDYSEKKLCCIDIGPVQLCRVPNRDDDNQSWDRIKVWLHSKRPDSVLYVSFGSECFFSSEQLREIAVGLRDSEHPFIWVVRGNGGGAESMDEWLPEELRRDDEQRGMILTEWAPQVAILNHHATGGFLTHCGWRSTVEAVASGMPVIAWPLHSDQFLNERMLVEVLQVGVRLLEGPRMRTPDAEGRELVKGAVIRDAVKLVLGGGDREKLRGMRLKAKRYKQMARSAMAQGGSSCVNLSRVIEQMNMLAQK